MGGRRGQPHWMVAPEDQTFVGRLVEQWRGFGTREIEKRIALEHLSKTFVQQLCPPAAQAAAQPGPEFFARSGSLADAQIALRPACGTAVAALLQQTVASRVAACPQVAGAIRDVSPALAPVVPPPWLLSGGPSAVSDVANYPQIPGLPAA